MIYIRQGVNVSLDELLIAVNVNEPPAIALGFDPVDGFYHL